MFQQHADQRMTCFVPSRKLLFFVGHRETPSFTSPANFVTGFLELNHSDRFLVGSSSQKCGLVQEIG